ncbi:SNG1 family protein [Aspergillus mulundensis]|uniref:DUF3533 domain-containing protein n=1 Tax=Aspergillus mulundensis TaxID=1810919 RepID=A0A3D8QZX2_9EURO|nr:Uncharacterized protein DSM5745_09104 [Aspergillus mulundensis]RDW67238.1 Uncharacterized protein DSM5745_09104 [Aspergillus mulundensis]
MSADAEDGEKETPEAVGFWDPALKSTRNKVFFKWGRTALLLCTFILCVLSLYWAVQFHSDDKVSNLKVWVVDFDNSQDALVGPAVTDLARQIATSSESKQNLGYTIKPAADFEDPVAVVQAVYDEHCWAAIIVNPDATTLLRDAVSSGNTSYTPSDAAQFVIISARDETTFANYITPSLNSFELQLRASFGFEWVRNLTSQSTNLTSVPPQAINPAIAFNTLDLRPFAPAAATPSVTIGLIYLIILSFFNFPFMMPVHGMFMKPNENGKTLKIPQWLVWRVCSSICTYFFLSLFYSFVSLAFQIPFSNDPAPDTVSANNPNAYGKGSFVVFWMLNWVGMGALGFPLENMSMILGFPYSALFLIFWVITNVSSGFYALDVAPGFFKWGYAWPLHRIVNALRTILFGTHSKIGLDFGVLFAWIGISLILFPFAAFILRWKMKRGL